MSLTKQRKKKLKRALKKENIKEGKLLRKINFWKKKGKSKKKIKKLRKNCGVGWENWTKSLGTLKDF